MNWISMCLKISLLRKNFITSVVFEELSWVNMAIHTSFLRKIFRTNVPFEELFLFMNNFNMPIQISFFDKKLYYISYIWILHQSKEVNICLFLYYVFLDCATFTTFQIRSCETCYCLSVSITKEMLFIMIFIL